MEIKKEELEKLIELVSKIRGNSEIKFQIFPILETVEMRDE